MKNLFNYLVLGLATFGFVLFHATVVPLSLPLWVIFPMAFTVGLGIGYAVTEVLNL